MKAKNSETMFTDICNVNGPILEVPQDYVPKVLISDDEFEEIYANREKASNKSRFHARDYAVEILHRCTKLAYENGDGVTQKILDELPKEALERLFWGLDSCSCCWRHCHNRPVAVDSLEDESMLDRATEEMVSKRDCFCYCRMGKRMIRRAFFAKKEIAEAPVEDPTESPIEWESESEDESSPVAPEPDDFQSIYDRRDKFLSQKDKKLAIDWATVEIEDWRRKWSKDTNDHWKVDPEWPMPALHQFMGERCWSEDLRKYFWAVSLEECCPRHMAKAPVAIDSNETTPENPGCWTCGGRRRHDLRRLQKAFQIAKALDEERETARLREAAQWVETPV